MPSKHQQAEEMRDDVPSTIARSDDKAVRTYKKTLESAEDSYGEGERAHRAAYGALKHPTRRWATTGSRRSRPGRRTRSPSKRRPTRWSGRRKRRTGSTPRASKAHLVEVARKLGVTGATRKRKDELVDEIRKANARATRQARS